MSSRRAAPPMDKEYHPASPKCQSERAAETQGLKPKRLLADTAYGTGKFLGWLVGTGAFTEWERRRCDATTDA